MAVGVDKVNQFPQASINKNTQITTIKQSVDKWKPTWSAVGTHRDNKMLGTENQYQRHPVTKELKRSCRMSVDQ